MNKSRLFPYEGEGASSLGGEGGGEEISVREVFSNTPPPFGPG